MQYWLERRNLSLKLFTLFVLPFILLTCLPIYAAVPKIKNGVISYNGGVMSDGKNIPFIDILEHYNDAADPWRTYREDIEAHFADIRNKLGATSVRLLVHPTHPSWGNVGLEFPTPREQELKNLGSLIDSAHAKGLQVYLVMLIPDEYKYLHPDTSDTFYANNHTSLMWNLFTFWDNVFNSAVAPRIDKISYVDIIGDFDAINVQGVSADKQINHQEWWRRVWPNFYSWFTYIPNSKKVFELIGGQTNPTYYIPAEINWVKSELAQHGWPAPSKYAFEAYACNSWASTGYGTWDDAYRDLFGRAAAAAGGYDKIIIEEIGVNSNGDACLDDRAGGEKTFMAAFSAIANLAPDVPVGIWNYYDAPAPPNTDRYGIYHQDKTLVQGWWVLPYFFKQ